ncbi:4-hydroxy-tetrahydrodipicolinate reductase [Desulfovibrio legallii]|jgi:4-hydroxy-tetrahydrodipicolinate reductase|uniref:4-hydroxy-tetrahydrodipicolinate reductase n=1 Tax=Desulfovibrio legallii TaxID=571438 RepID=A0A1G7KF06_9BACT|nr:4-hydroxy-tetrahydrodipicolinate reductase [Desulfovibrio legallii]SDF35706.1 dihydrodipicolinate reductase [Desulfovibrio legallii]
MSTAIIVVGANGRMGRTISHLAATEPAYSLAGMVDSKERVGELGGASCPVSADLGELLTKVPGAVIIDFTAPAVSLASARAAAAAGNALVIGTTGFSEAEKAELEALARRAPIFWASNMSIGVNVLRKILPELARALGEPYDIEIVEIHHNRKKDSPSGTALTLGEGLAEARGWKLNDVRCSARDGIIGARPKAQIGIQAVRGGDVVGVHTVYFMGPGERIEVSHHAHSRETFAQGALRAAAWLANKKPGKLYGMADMF